MSHLSAVGSGVALAITLVVAYVLCAIAVVVFPAPQFSHMWLELFTAAPVGSGEAWLEGIVASIAVGFILGYVFAWAYNTVGRKY